jgi:hypothetical protein
MEGLHPFIQNQHTDLSKKHSPNVLQELSDKLFELDAVVSTLHPIFKTARTHAATNARTSLEKSVTPKVIEKYEEAIKTLKIHSDQVSALETRRNQLHPLLLAAPKSGLHGPWNEMSKCVSEATIKAVDKVLTEKESTENLDYFETEQAVIRTIGKFHEILADPSTPKKQEDNSRFWNSKTAFEKSISDIRIEDGRIVATKLGLARLKGISLEKLQNTLEKKKKQSTKSIVSSTVSSIASTIQKFADAIKVSAASDDDYKELLELLKTSENQERLIDLYMSLMEIYDVEEFRCTGCKHVAVPLLGNLCGPCQVQAYKNREQEFFETRVEWLEKQTDAEQERFMSERGQWVTFMKAYQTFCESDGLDGWEKVRDGWEKMEKRFSEQPRAPAEPGIALVPPLSIASPPKEWVRDAKKTRKRDRESTFPEVVIEDLLSIGAATKDPELFGRLNDAYTTGGIKGLYSQLKRARAAGEIPQYLLKFYNIENNEPADFNETFPAFESQEQAEEIARSYTQMPNCVYRYEIIKRV